MSSITSARLLRLEGADLVDHDNLDVGDEVYYLLEYAARRDFSFGLANDLINNLKKDTKYRKRPEVWQWKTGAIRECGRAFGRNLRTEWLRHATLVPVPPSKIKSDPEYDDRMLQVLYQIPADFVLDVRELVLQKKSTPAAHLSGGERLTVDELISLYEINEAVAVPSPTAIGVFDDVLTLGSHFRAMKSVLQKRFPEVRVFGFFVTRRVHPK